MTVLPDDIVKLLLAFALGGMIGAERELRDKSAGFRTLMFICAGATLFTIFSIRIAAPAGADPARIAAQIVAGIGFLGAGAILRDGGEIRGLTTASTIWLVAALGVGIGSGEYLFSTLATILILLALWVFPGLERLMNRLRQVRTYQITTAFSQQKYAALLELVRRHNLRVLNSRRARRGSQMITTLIISGRPTNHEALAEALLADPEITDFET